MNRKKFHLQGKFSRKQLAPNSEIKIKLVRNYNTANKMLQHWLILNMVQFPRFSSHKEQMKTVLNRTTKAFEERMLQRTSVCLSLSIQLLVFFHLFWKSAITWENDVLIKYTKQILTHLTAWWKRKMIKKNLKRTRSQMGRSDPDSFRWSGFGT